MLNAFIRLNFLALALVLVELPSLFDRLLLFIWSSKRMCRKQLNKDSLLLDSLFMKSLASPNLLKLTLFCKVKQPVSFVGRGDRCAWVMDLALTDSKSE